VVVGTEKRKLVCRCDCGTTHTATAPHLVDGDTRSCGCLRRDRSAEVHTTHGEASVRRGASAEYKIWSGIIRRCTNPNEKCYSRYGGRGVSVCDRWRSYECFLEDMGRRPSSLHSIDRIDPSGNYEPSNCRWATSLEQGRNRTGLTYITIGNETLPIWQWSERSGVPIKIISQRLIRDGWSPDRAVFSEPRKCASPKYTDNRRG